MLRLLLTPAPDSTGDSGQAHAEDDHSHCHTQGRPSARREDSTAQDKGVLHLSAYWSDSVTDSGFH